MKKLILASILLFSSFSRADNFLMSELATVAEMKNLNITAQSLPEVRDLQINSQGDTDDVVLTLAYRDLPPVQVFLRGPKGFFQASDHSFQALFLATGFFTGADSTVLLGAMPKTVFVGFNYPYGLDDISNDPGKVLQTFRVTPGLMALTLKWLSVQNWLAPQRLMAMGVSLGGLFLPTALHISQEMHVMISHTIFAFTGSDLKAILVNNLKDQVPPNVVDAVTFLVPAINTLNDPRLHVPFLKGSFLVIYADQDQIIPRQASEDLLSRLPAPKQSVILHGGHIDTDKPELIQATKDAVLAWLSE